MKSKLLTVCLLAPLCGSPRAVAQEPDPPPPPPVGAVEKPAAEEQKEEVPAEFLRTAKNRHGMVVRLETATVRYTAPLSEEQREAGQKPLVVDLIAAIHVGDRPYYKDLQEQFEQYDTLLYELVKPDWAPVPTGTPEASMDPIAMILDLGLDFVQLVSQTDHIDYRRENFVHADLSPEQMLECMKKRGDNLVTVTLDVVSDMIRQQNLAEQRALDEPEGMPPALDLFSMLLDPDGLMQLKRYLAGQIAWDVRGPGLGETLNTLLITDRNDACMKVLQKELARGQKKIGIFYGAAHMKDFDRRLREDFGLQRAATTWTSAWDLR